MNLVFTALSGVKMATYKNIMVLEPPKMTVRVADTAASINATDWTSLATAA